jgi:hypothetical protein
VTVSYASLLEAVPSLATVLGTHEATAIGHRPRLPVIVLEAGPWTPPAGSSRVGFVVLAGLLLSEPAMALAAPGDFVLPSQHAGRQWTACTGVRLALIGDAFRDALADRPRVLARVFGRAIGPGSWRPDGAPAESRLETLFWRLATRCGQPRAGGMFLPLELAPSMLARIAGLGEAACSAALDALATAGRARVHENGWLLRESEPCDRGVALHARMARQHAVSREANAVLLELSAELAAHRGAGVLSSAGGVGRGAVGEQPQHADEPAHLQEPPYLAVAADHAELRAAVGAGAVGADQSGDSRRVHEADRSEVDQHVGHPVVERALDRLDERRGGGHVDLAADGDHCA